MTAPHLRIQWRNEPDHSGRACYLARIDKSFSFCQLDEGPTVTLVKITALTFCLVGWWNEPGKIGEALADQLALHSNDYIAVPIILNYAPQQDGPIPFKPPVEAHIGPQSWITADRERAYAMSYALRTNPFETGVRP